MSNESRAGDAQRALADGVAAAVSIDGDVPLRWVAVIETMDTEGKRCMWRLAAEDMASWDALSLLEYGITKQRLELMRPDREGG